ncbi:MAG: response regulator transcription factor [Chitinophagaceae bacterium]|nr:response regulator transcription factor [Chitinophagaceae bacterium]
MTTVLVVDDDLDLLEMVTFVLTAHNFQVHTLARCKAFFETVSTVKPEAILMDVFLGECDGRDLCRQYKSADSESLPVVLYSAGDVSSASVEESKADIFLRKPFDVNILIQRLRSLVR